VYPEIKYANLYHWLFGDLKFMQASLGYSLPILAYPYSKNAAAP
jgi:hypothetical protein